MVGTLVRGVGVHHGVNFDCGSAKVCSPAIFETCFSYDKDIWIAITDYYKSFYIIVLLTLTAKNTPINKFHSLIIFSLLINAGILLLNCLVLILNKFYSFIIFSLLINAVILLLNIIWTFI